MKQLAFTLVSLLALASCTQNEQNTEYKHRTEYYDIKIIDGMLKDGIVKNVLRSNRFNIGDTVKYDGDKAVIINKVECNLCK